MTVFSDLGGTDAVAAGLLESVRVVFGVELPGNCLFEDGGTVANMVELISRA